VLYGCYGAISAEAMAIGTPVICYIRPDLEFYGELPIFRADKYNLADRIDHLIQNIELRKELSKKGEIYASEIHDAPQVAMKLLKIYNR